MSAIHFESKLYKPDDDAKIGTWALISLPQEASAKLPSRGMVMIEGTLKDVRFRVVLQPDGQGSHWLGLSKDMCRVAELSLDDSVSLKIQPTKDWSEPELTADVKKALTADPQAQAMWTSITPMARWEWLNWMGSVKLPKTLQERPEKLCSMLKAGKRRPCCFNRSLQMPPTVAELL